MPKTKQQKTAIIKDLADKLSKSKSLVFTKYHGLKVSEVRELRGQMRAQGADYGVVKNSLLKIALDKSAFKDAKLDKQAGPVAVAFGYEDEVAPAKLCWQFSKKHKALEITGGLLGQELLTKEAVLGLAKLPSKQELIAKVVGSIGAPLSGLVNVLAGNLRGLLNVLKAVKEQKE